MFIKKLITVSISLILVFIAFLSITPEEINENKTESKVPSHSVSVEEVKNTASTFENKKVVSAGTIDSKPCKVITRVVSHEPKVIKAVEEKEMEDKKEYSYENLPLTDDFKKFVSEVSEFYEFEEDLIYKIMYVESTFNRYADNGICKGLMQVHKNFYSSYAMIEDGLPYEISKDCDVFDPYVNTILGVRVLDDWRRMGTAKGYTELVDWLSFYNAGFSYETTGNTEYANIVMSVDLKSLKFPEDCEIVG